MCVLLDAAEMAHFKRQGYVVKRQILDPALMSRAREAMSRHFAAQQASDKWEEWMGFRSSVPVDDKPWLVEMLPKNPSVYGIVEQLLGKGMVAPVGNRVRGLNCNLPLGAGAPHPEATATSAGGQGVRIDQLHADAHAFNLGVVAYFDDVVKGGGGFTVAPQSHRRLWNTFELAYDTLQRAASEFATEGQHHSQAYHQVREAMHRELSGGVEITGAAGTVIFWHHRLLHGAGTNRGVRIRAACLHDFHRTDLQQCRERVPSATDMWRDWSEAVRACPEPALPLPPPQTNDGDAVEVRFVVSEAGPLPQPDPAWLCWAHRALGPPQHLRNTDSTAFVHRLAEQLLSAEGVKHRDRCGWELRYEYPPRLMPRSEELSLLDVGAGHTLEVLCRLVSEPVPGAAETRPKL